MPIKFIIRPETHEDNQQVAHIVKTAFLNGERGYHGEGELVEKLRDFDGYIPALSIVAEQEEALIGHIILTRVFIQTAEGKVPSLILAPVSVLPDYQMQGVGGALINAVHEAALNIGEEHVFLLGHETYYPKFGYQPSRNFGITFPDGRDDNHCMGIELVKDSLAAVNGTLEYSQPFYEI